MKPIRIFRHRFCEDPGYLGEFLDRRGVAWEMACVGNGEAVPQQTDDVSALIFMGGAGSVNDGHDWIEDELELIRRAYARDLPILGICFGAQLMSKALGGDVYAGPGMEIGWHPVYPTRHAAVSLFSEVGDELPVFHWHQDTFTIPAGFTPVLQSRCFQHQAFMQGRHLAMQFHLEVTRELIEDSLTRFAHCIPPPTVSVQSSEQVRAEISRHLGEMHKVADCIYGWWLDKYVFLPESATPPLAVGSQTQDNSQ